jgi:S1-C subfamily serine protease
MLQFNFWVRIAAVVALSLPTWTAASGQQPYHRNDVWMVQAAADPNSHACVVAAQYPDGTGFSLTLTTGSSWPVALARSTGYQPGQRRVLTLYVDRDLLHETLATVDSDGIIRLDVPANEKTLSELAEGNFLHVRSSVGSARYSLDGARAAIAAGRRCMFETAPGAVSGRQPAVAGYLGRADADQDQRARMDLQEALIWAGFYDGMIDGDFGPRTLAAMRAFMRAIGADANRAPTEQELGRLLRLAENEKSKAGFRIVRDERARVGIGIPSRFAPNTTPTQRGTAYTSPSGDLKIDTLFFRAGERTLTDLFDQISKRGPIRFVDYAKPPNDGEFVVSGRDHEKHYYFKAVEAQEGIVAFSIAHSYASKDQMSRVVVAMANFFAPLSWLNAAPASPGASAAAPTSPPAKATQPSADEDGGGGSGTGFVVTTSGHIVTNAHVVQKCRSIRVARVREGAVQARLVAIDKVNDLALLQANVTAASLPRFRTGARIGEPVNVFGFPLVPLLASTGNFTIGNVTATSGIGDDTRMLQISAPLQPGNSGGPVLDESGYVVGVTVAKLNVLKLIKATGDIAQNVNFALKSTSALSFLDANGITVSLAGQAAPKAPADVAELAKDFTVLVTCE